MRSTPASATMRRESSALCSIPHCFHIPLSSFSGPIQIPSKSVTAAARRKSAVGLREGKGVPSAQSVPDNLKKIGFSSPHAARARFAISSGKRSRFSSEPPKLSVRVFERGERKVWMRYPCAP